MILFGINQASKIAKLVINDVGAILKKASLDRISEFVGAAYTSGGTFASFDEAVAYFKKVAAQFGNLSDAQWETMTKHSTISTEDGKYKLHYDLAIFEGNFINLF